MGAACGKETSCGVAQLSRNVKSSMESSSNFGPLSALVQINPDPCRTDKSLLHAMLSDELILHILSFVSYGPMEYERADCTELKRLMWKNYVAGFPPKTQLLVTSPFSSVKTGHLFIAYHQARKWHKKALLQRFCTLVNVLPLVCQKWHELVEGKLEASVSSPLSSGSPHDARGCGFGERANRCCDVLWKDALTRYVESKCDQNVVEWLQRRNIKLGVAPTDSHESRIPSGEAIIKSLLQSHVDDDDEKIRHRNLSKAIYKELLAEDDGPKFWTGHVLINSRTDGMRRRWRRRSPNDFDDEEYHTARLELNKSWETRVIRDVMKHRAMGDRTGLPIHDGPWLILLMGNSLNENDDGFAIEPLSEKRGLMVQLCECWMPRSTGPAIVTVRSEQEVIVRGIDRSTTSGLLTAVVEPSSSREKWLV